ncbi:DNA adenine methylase [Salinisphaera hydrothermalis]|uniref:Site-specific DNA-methyltransferase (adenine-specific) n=1 Tax=Salinisphaera hydrothermalis (strain C41B8) TaxID=1304275 RepID=A0A084IND1_SALHC|nr:Dam family site-specific DNA-(adenine-N6)-methyltransferase [Salinisphaera hydrothermalis]KEZ78215.1 DNA adenine methylase [Salinisphaera hydrothermalis C41B8]
MLPELAHKKPIDRVYPVVKWAGGKRWFVSRFGDLFPRDIIRYIEPFAGGAAVFFSLRPESAILSDANSELINCYSKIKNNPKKIIEILERHQKRHDEQYYYSVRDESPSCKYEQAARFLYLNRTCWNGLYRVNKKGKFNVPIGTKSKVLLPTDDFYAASRLLSRVELIHSDFEPVIAKAEDGDFLFVDPPYTVNHNNNGFVKYNEKIFSWSDQERLFGSLKKASQRGVKILATNADHQSIKELYELDFDLMPISRNSIISGKSSFRRQTSELLIKNY